MAISSLNDLQSVAQITMSGDHLIGKVVHGLPYWCFNQLRDEHKRLCNRNSYTLASRWRRPGPSAHASILHTATFGIFSWVGVKASWLHVSKLGLSKDRFNLIFMTTRVQPCYTCPPPNGRFGYCLSGLWDESQLKFATFILNFNTKYRVMALHMKRKQGYPRSSNTSQAESHSS